ncbi:cobalamin synthesis protein P47K [Nitzschia inconspicua]|uniref:Cobalamin synthesis protein P47K n=1 Tax=Nitzschia inconspicua TaxID=303405 RepID=A0A9K3LKJ1_9STRA|nr:cobalamin synthesis protein P47K [Nitzschia inconspicua]KAG7362496.1 cobalamin synthesis protein P47K [Nitzschia inconspicua]
MDKVIILGAAGRDFHDFMVYWAVRPNTQVVCFTETQIPGIENRHFPKEMCRNDVNGNRYPDGIDIYPESQLEELIQRFEANICTLAYSDLSYHTVQSLASRVNTAGCQFVQLPPVATQIKSTKPLVSIVASRTGVGKSQTTRWVANYYKKKGLKVAAIRHPMPYDEDLNFQRCERFETMEDMDKYRCTIEEREEYYRHIEDGTLLFAGVDYEMILREAEKDADLILWDGGNNDFSFYKADLTITLVDSLRPTDELHYFPGETNVRMADAILITKTNELKSVLEADHHAQQLRDKGILKHDMVPILYGKSKIVPQAKGMTTEEAASFVNGKRVLVVDDGPTLTHGGLPSGAGYALCESLGGIPVDPRPFAKGSLQQTFSKFTHLKNCLPAMGYGEEQVQDLQASIDAVECDVVMIGTPIDISQVLDIGDKPYVVARYDLEVVPQHQTKFLNVLDTAIDPEEKKEKKINPK